MVLLKNGKGVVVMIRIAVVDDDNIMISKISTLINKHIKQEKHIDSFNSGTDFFYSSNKFSYDILFLDIDMPEIDGFTIAGELHAIKPDMPIIFISNMENLILSSIRYSPLAFIRKQQMEKDLLDNLDLIHNKLSLSNAAFIVNVNNTDISIPLREIMYFEMINHDLYVYTQYNNYKKMRNRNNETNLKKLYEQYSSEGFILASRNYLVNYRFINFIEHDKIILKNGGKIIISSRNSNEIKRVYQKFLMAGGIV